jgi:hypothetical protein
MEGTEVSSAIPGFSSLSLSRPDSYSAAGRVADASITVLKQPQPMLYSPASGLGELCCLLFSSSTTALQTQQRTHARKRCSHLPAFLILLHTTIFITMQLNLLVVLLQ